ncbi:MAG: polysaccharide deacetylase family protein [Betaproteobacteria bacterium]|nr:polysaccharide deacetylase family protein [Betaproteobacteria bacterium]
MPGKRALFAAALHASGISRVVYAVRGAFIDEVRILAYHRVLPDWHEPSFPFDLELISASTEEFTWQMEHVRRHFNPIRFADLIAFQSGRGVLPSRPIIVTFDDGFDDNFHHAFPVLRRLGIPATFFLSTGYIGGNQTFWYDWLCHLCLMQHAAGKDFDFAGRVFPANGESRDRAFLDELFLHAKSLPDPILRGAIAASEQRYSAAFPAGGFAESRPLTWDQVRVMAGSGMEFGSHAVSHPVLTRTSNEQLEHEIRQSKQTIEEQTGQSIEVIAYPVGEHFAFDQRVMNAVRSAGYLLGVSYLSGSNRIGQFDSYAVRRLHVERYTTRAEFTSSLAFPDW